MTISNKVVWSEGLFLRPQHFQQQDRYFERYIDGRCEAIGATREHHDREQEKEETTHRSEN